MSTAISWGPVGEGHEPNDQHVRLWGVGRMGSTDEVLEQRGSGTSPGASAESMEGSRSAKRNARRRSHVPDTVPD